MVARRKVPAVGEIEEPGRELIRKGQKGSQSPLLWSVGGGGVYSQSLIRGGGGGGESAVRGG